MGRSGTQWVGLGLAAVVLAVLACDGGAGAPRDGSVRPAADARTDATDAAGGSDGGGASGGRGGGSGSSAGSGGGADGDASDVRATDADATAGDAAGLTDARGDASDSDSDDGAGDVRGVDAVAGEARAADGATSGGGDGGGDAATGGAPGSFSSITTVVPYRAKHTATLLKNGKVLIAGGWGYDLVPVATMELFDPVTRTFSAAGAMSPPRLEHSSTLLANGKVLIVGGQVYGGAAGATTCTALAQLYDPDTGTFSPLPDLAHYQCNQVTAVLPDGRVLVLGGYNEDKRMEVFDPATGQFTRTGAAVKARFSGNTATVLNDGRVLVVGGVADAVEYQATAEVYDPRTATFSAVGNMAAPRGYHTANLLPDGKVLIAGGIETNTSAGPTFRPTAELFDPTTNTFVAGPAMALFYDNATATTLLDNKILIVGGLGASRIPMAGTQLYDPTSGRFSLGATLSVGRYTHTATLLSGGRVLIVGIGTGAEPRVVPAELYQP